MNRTREWAGSTLACSFFVAVFAVIMATNPPENKYGYLYDVTLTAYVLLSAVLFGSSIHLFNSVASAPTLDEQVRRGRVQLTRNFYFVLNKDPNKGNLDWWYIENYGYYVGIMFYDKEDETFTREEIKRLMISLNLYGTGAGND